MDCVLLMSSRETCKAEISESSASHPAQRFTVTQSLVSSSLIPRTQQIDLRSIPLVQPTLYSKLP